MLRHFTPIKADFWTAFSLFSIVQTLRMSPEVTIRSGYELSTSGIHIIFVAGYWWLNSNFFSSFFVSGFACTTWIYFLKNCTELDSSSFSEPIASL